MQVSAVDGPGISTPTASAAAATNTAAQAETATNAFGLSFESLLKIILTQLTYQDPLKPMDNFEFVSQLAQFSQIQQGQVASDRLLQLVSAQSTLQATSLLGKTVDIATGDATLTGEVSAVSFQNGEARLSIRTADGQTIANLSLAAVSKITEGN